jgi:hypothetical protein
MSLTRSTLGILIEAEVCIDPLKDFLLKKKQD